MVGNTPFPSTGTQAKIASRVLDVCQGCPKVLRVRERGRQCGDGRPQGLSRRARPGQGWDRARTKTYRRKDHVAANVATLSTGLHDATYNHIIDQRPIDPSPLNLPQASQANAQPQPHDSTSVPDQRSEGDTVSTIVTTSSDNIETRCGGSGEEGGEVGGPREASTAKAYGQHT